MNEQNQRVRDYYDNVSLPKDRMEKLMRAAAACDVVPDAQPAWRANIPCLQWRSSLQVGLACALLLMMSLWMHNTGSETGLSERTLREVAMNHTTRLEPEFRGSSLAMLDNSMHQLPFNLVLPKSIDNAYELIGSRYCSLGGVLAAHVKLHDKHSGKPMSLFVTGNAAELMQIETQQKKLDGVAVEIWREGGLFYASAERS